MTPLRPYENESPAPISRRFFAFAIDAILILTAHVVTYNVGSWIASTTTPYQESSARLSAAQKRCYALQEEAHLQAYEGEGEERFANPVSEESMFLDWAHMHVVKAFNEDPEYFAERDVAALPEDFGAVSASYATDQLAYFYVSYALPQGLVQKEGQQSDEAYYCTIFQGKAYAYDDASLWVYDETNFALPTLKSKYAYDLYRYLKVDASFQEGLSIYNLMAKTFQDLWDQEVTVLTGSPAYSSALSDYKAEYRYLSFIIDGVGILAYLLCFLLLYILPEICFKSHQSLGKKWTHVLVVDKEGYPILPHQILIHALFEFFGFFGITLVSDFLVGGSNSAWIYPVAYLGNIPVSLLLVTLLFAGLTMISWIVSLFLKHKEKFADLAAGTYCIDLRYYTEHTGNPLIDEEEAKAEKRDDPLTQVVERSTIRKD